jgi:methionyl-tRNA formyltransferase
MSDTRIVFMGTPEFAVPCLDMLVNEHHQVLAVVSQPDRPKGRGQKLAPSPVKEAALAYGIPVLTPERIKENFFIETVKELQPDMIIVVAFGQFLPKALLDLPPLGCVNVHASLLPKYRGAAPIHWSVIHGEPVTGITTMYMDAGMDTGDMILKAEIPIGAEETTGELHDKLKTLGAQLLAETIRQIRKGTAPREPQKQAEASYAPLLKRETEKIDWGKSAKDIHNLVRGLNPWPGAYCLQHNKTVKIWKTRLTGSETDIEPGRIVDHSGIICVGTGSGELELLEVQPESKRRMSAGEYLRGHSNDAIVLG